MRYGLPYKGSKTKLADTIVEQLPPAGVLYDLFAGGCAITHAAILSGKWGRVVANDIAAYPQLFKDAAEGKYRNEYKWVGREDFFKSDEPFDKLIFSFGNDCRTYLYAQGDVEKFKRAMHYAICLHDYAPMRDEFGCDLSPIESQRTMKQRRYAAYRILARANQFKNWWDGGIHLENLERLERLQNLERLERLQGLESLRNLDKLLVSRGSYDTVRIEPDSVIYCDIPYVNTNAYGARNVSDFDYEAFYSWAEEQTVPVYISEYWMPQDRFECIWETRHNSYINADRPTVSIERLFVPIGRYYPKTTLF